MNNDPWADRDDGGNGAALYEGYESGENVKTPEQQMGMTAVKAAELEYQERARKSRENVERQIQEAREAFARRSVNMTPSEEVAARSEMASDFAKKATEIMNGGGEGESSLKAEIEALKNTIADLNAKIEGLESIIQQGQEESDRKLNNYAEAIAGMAEEPGDETREEGDTAAMPEDVQNELIKNSGMDLADDENHEDLDLADGEDREEMGFADESEDRGELDLIDIKPKKIDLSELPDDIDLFLDLEDEKKGASTSHQSRGCIYRHIHIHTDEYLHTCGVQIAVTNLPALQETQV